MDAQKFWNWKNINSNILLKKLGSIKWQCRAYIAGKGLKKGKDTVVEGGKKIGEKILDKSGISSFLKGWGN